MKKIFIYFICLFLLISCSDNQKEKKEESLIKETGEIMETYADTLEGSIENAKEVRDIMNTRNQELKNNLHEVK